MTRDQEGGAEMMMQAVLGGHVPLTLPPTLLRALGAYRPSPDVRRWRSAHCNAIAPVPSPQK